MLIKHTNVLRGPNYWSITRHHLIVMLLDIGELEQKPTNKIPGFYERLKSLLPSLYTHKCSEDCEGGFFERVDRGTWMGHVIEHIAIEIQTLAGMPVEFGQTRSAGKPGEYYVVFGYIDEEAGRYAGESAVRIAEALINGAPFDLQETLTELRWLHDQNALGPSTRSIYNEARERGIPALRLDDGVYMQLGYGAKQKRFEATIVCNTSGIAIDKAGNKNETKKLLAAAYIPVPKGFLVSNVNKLDEVLNTIRFPIVIKPLDSNQGKGATINIKDAGAAREAFTRALNYSTRVVVEEFIPGYDYRALVVNGKFVAAARRTPACVKGDGMHTVAQLVDIENKNPKRGIGHASSLTRIEICQDTLDILKNAGKTLDSVPKKGEVVFLKTTANLSTGGTAEDVTDSVDPYNIRMFERVSRVIGLNICGIDIMAPDLETPISENGGAVIEVNAAPGFRMHLEPTIGKPRNVAKPVVDMLFPDKDNGRIPIIAVTGTNGKTTTTRLTAQMVQQYGYNTGFTTTDGIYLNNELVYKGDCSGPSSAQTILKDPLVEFAVLECARGGILRSGLGFDQCSCAIITNVADDHLGLNGIDTLEQLARVKSVVAESVSDDGYVVLNADDDLAYAMKDNVTCNVVLFSLFADNIRIRQHCEKGGIAAVYEEGYVIIYDNNRMIPVEAVENIPLTHNGLARFNVANVLGSVLAAYVSGISLPAIRCTLRRFYNSPEHTPGRMNLFNCNDFSVLIDYAHNTHGVRALGEFVKNVNASKKIGVITAPGDRRNEDIMALGEEAARIFDEIIIRHDEDLRGRTEFEISSLLRTGIQKAAPHKKISYFSNEAQSLDFALRTATQNCFIVVLVENVNAVISQVKEFQKQQTAVRLAV